VHLDTLRGGLVAGTNASAKEDYVKYFVVKDTPKRGRRVAVRQEEVDAFKANKAGFFVNIECGQGPLCWLCRVKDSTGKNFDNLKHALDMKRLRVHSDEAMYARLFVQFKPRYSTLQ